MASKVFKTIHDVELGKPVAFLNMGSDSARSDNNAEGRGYGKKRMATGNKLHRGSKNLPQPEKVLTYHWYLIV